MERTPVTVTQLNSYVKSLLGNDRALSDVLVAGEISSFKLHAATGHLYFDLKDSSAAVRVVMFSSDASKISFKPSDGMKVIIRGRVGVFEKTGVYQIYAKTMEPDGLGSLYLEFLKLKEKLKNEGYFDEARKRTPKRMPRTVAVITSKSGAVIRDIENVLSRRYPLCKIILFPAAVQGEEAPRSIVEAFEKVNSADGIDTVILARGGGSQLDLWCFNDERVAKAVYNCRYPVISAVGHETDFTIADFVADRRAPTPSAAAELAAADVNDILKYISNERMRMNAALSERLLKEENRISTVMSHRLFSKPLEFLEDKQAEIVYLTERISRTANFSEIMKNKTDSAVLRINAAYSDIKNRAEQSIISVLPRLENSFVGYLSAKQNSVSNMAARLKGMDPMNVLSRGFAAVEKNGRIITDINEIEINDNITVRFGGGEVDATVTERRI